MTLVALFFLSQQTLGAGGKAGRHMPPPAILSVWEGDRSKDRKSQQGHMMAPAKVCTECYMNNREAPNFENREGLHELARPTRATVPGKEVPLTSKSCSRRAYILGNVWIHF